jgi:hypothetical protein
MKKVLETKKRLKTREDREEGRKRHCKEPEAQAEQQSINSLNTMSIDTNVSIKCSAKVPREFFLGLPKTLQVMGPEQIEAMYRQKCELLLRLRRERALMAGEGSSEGSSAKTSDSVKLQYTVDKLNDTNYMVWKFKMKLLLMKEDCYDVIEKETITEADKAKDLKALQVIGLSVSDNQLVHIQAAKGGQEAWMILKEYHQKTMLSCRVRIIKQILKSTLPIGGSMTAHLNGIFEKLNLLSEMNAGFEDDVAISIILASLNSEYDGIVTALEAWPEDRLKLQAVKMKLIEEYEKIKDKGEASTSAMMNKERNKVCYFCEGAHFKRDCAKYKAWLQKKEANKESAKMSRMEQWYMSSFVIDSGATRHMCKNKDFFSNLQEVKISINVANGATIYAKGIGCVNLKIYDTENKEFFWASLTDVLYVPEIEENLLSVRRLAEKVSSVQFNKDSCTIKDRKGTRHIGTWRGGLYYLNTNEGSYKASEEKCVHEWHRVLAHRNYEDIKRNKDLQLKDCECEDLCEGCIIGKMSRKPFIAKGNKYEAPFDCVVSDICGPLQEESYGRKKYFATFIDVFSDYTEVVLLSHKNDVIKHVKNYVERVKTQFGKVIKVFRTDRGGEYLNKDLQEYLKSKGIQFQCTVGYSPQQNGVAERKNRTLMEATRTVIEDSGLSMKYWAEAISTVNFVNNRLVTEKRKESPFEIIFKRKSDLNELHRFGSDVYVKVPDEKRRKLDPKALKLKFLGYDENSKGYRVGDTNGRVRISRDVIFTDKTSKEDERALARPNPAIVVEVDNSKDNEEEDEEFHDCEDNLEEQNHQEEHQVEAVEDVQPLRRSNRGNFGIPPAKYGYLCSGEINEPKGFKEAIASPQSKEWLHAMDEEVKSIKECKVWDLVDLPKDRKAIGCKWVFKVKKDENGNVSRYKARLVAKGFSQKYGVDYDEVFAPVVRSTTFRTLLSIAGNRNYRVKHYDVKTAFLNGNIEEEIFMKQPEGYEEGDKVCFLRKGLYGLKQAARQWNKEIDKVLKKSGYSQSAHDPCLYCIDRDNSTNYILIHVDDILMASDCEELMNKAFKDLNEEFELKDLGDIKVFLSIEVERNVKGYAISQSRYIDEVVKDTGLEDAKGSKLPLDQGYEKFPEENVLDDNKEYQRIIGMLLYISTNTRPDIAASVSILSQRIKAPRKADLNEVKRVIRYLKATKDLKLQLNDNSCANKELQAYADANWAESRSDRKSNTGFICQLNGGTVSWACRRQSCVSLSSTEAEYVALSETAQEIVWLNNLIGDLGVKTDGAIRIFDDNQSCIKMSEGSKFSNRTKHIDTKYHFIKDLKDKEKIKVEYVCTEDNIADIMTKALSGERIKHLLRKGHIFFEEEC